MTAKTNRCRWSERLYWAIVLVWAGLVVAAAGVGALPRLGEADAWNWVLLGAGLLALGRCAFRAGSPDRPDPEAGELGWATGFTVLGLAGFVTLWIVASAALVGFGGAMLISALRPAGAEHGSE